MEEDDENDVSDDGSDDDYTPDENPNPGNFDSWSFFSSVVRDLVLLFVFSFFIPLGACVITSNDSDRLDRVSL